MWYRLSLLSLSLGVVACGQTSEENTSGVGGAGAGGASVGSGGSAESGGSSPGGSASVGGSSSLGGSASVGGSSSSGGSGGDAGSAMGGNNPGTGGVGGDAGSPMGGSAGVAGTGSTCDVPTTATPEQVASTPRDDAEAEALALIVDREIVATTETFERVKRDLENIRAEYAEVESVYALGAVGLNELELRLDPAGAMAYTGGAFPELECLNNHYGADAGSLVLDVFVSLQFEGRFNLNMVGRDYTALEHVVQASPTVLIGGSDSICVRTEGDRYDYLFDHGSGDCPAGCINHDLWGFSVDLAGVVTYHGSTLEDSLDADWYASGFVCET